MKRKVTHFFGFSSARHHYRARLAQGCRLLVLLTVIAATDAFAAQQNDEPAPAVTADAPVNSAGSLGSEGRVTANVVTGAKLPDEAIQGVAWINQQPKANYTLQLMAAVSTKPLYTFAHKQALPGPLAIAGLRRDEKVLYLLLQGSYTSVGEAESAAAGLEQSIGERPWVRHFSALPELFDSSSPPRQDARVSREPIAFMGASWLWSRNPVHYTIQLMGDRRAAPLRAFAARHRPDAPVSIVRVMRHGKPWYLLLAGDYATEEEAVAAVKTLSKEMRGRGPWPRHFASLQDQMVLANH